MVFLIDLNTTEDDETLSFGSVSASLSSPTSSNSGCGGGLNLTALSSASPPSVCLELWHACGGPAISLPKKKSVVVYFPQGHLEHVSDFSAAASVYDLPHRVFCRVLDVKLHAEAATDEVYAQVTLVPESEQFEQKLLEGKVEAGAEEEDVEASVKATTPHMFCKTLTASDTSTHGGFSVPRRAAEDCFPPLDYNQQRPSQELVAKDLHGLEWKFRHIYRGQPRRHLLTTGWSAFVNKKKLVSGDAVLFLRGEDDELRLGIRRAAQVKGGFTFPVLCSQQLNHSTLTDVVAGITMRNSFSICYNPRAISSEFVIPLHKFMKSLDPSFAVGMRFKLRFETEDAAERRYTGLVTGIGDFDPVRWPGSKWRCLLVRWDDIDSIRTNRVSPWDIEASGSVSGSNGLMVPGSKRTRMGLAPEKTELPNPDGFGSSDLGESLRFQKVLQGQEIFNFSGVDDQNRHPSGLRMSFPGSNVTGSAAIGSGFRNSHDISCEGTGFGESFQFHKVLQGQENFSNQPYGRAPTTHEAYDDGNFANRNGWPVMMQGYNAHLQLSQASSPSSVLMFQQASNPAFKPPHRFYGREKDQGVPFHISEKCLSNFTPSSLSECRFRGEDPGGMNNTFGLSKKRFQLGGITQGQDSGSSCKSSCRLFGFSLTEAKKGENTTPVPASLNPRAFRPHMGEPMFYQKPVVMLQADTQWNSAAAPQTMKMLQ